MPLKMMKFIILSGRSFKNVKFIERRCFTTLRGKFYATSTDAVSNLSNDYNLLDEKVEKYSVFQPTPISIAHFIEFGRTASQESSFVFLKREVPVRLANIMKELMLMPEELRRTHACGLVINHYAHSFQDIIAFENANQKDPEVMKQFTQTLFNIRERHANTVPTMAEAVMEVKNNYSGKAKNGKNGNGKLPKFGKNIQYFLDRLYTSRISLRMLINQHTLLFSEPSRNYLTEMEEGKPKLMIGSLDPDCEVGEVVQQAYDNARFLCEQYYLSAPELVYESHDASREKGEIKLREKQIGKIGVKNVGQQDPLSFVYLPSHLYHILFEVFKNAMRATIDQAGGEDAVHLPPIEVFAVKGQEDVTIHVRDRGGGIPRRLIGSIFEYLYTTATPVITSSTETHDVSSMMSSHMNTVPLAGYGYGLPLSRLYARYFGGDLELYSDEGWGTDAVIYLHALAGSAKERLPVYHETGSKKIYEAQLTASAWTTESHPSTEKR